MGQGHLFYVLLIGAERNYYRMLRFSCNLENVLDITLIHLNDISPIFQSLPSLIVVQQEII